VDVQPKTEQAQPNVQQAVPFFWVADIEASLRFYVDGLGFAMTKKWIPHDKLEWCWLGLGGVALMLQEYRPGKLPTDKRGEGVSICFQCKDAIAIYRDAIARGLQPQRPFVGNGMWVTILHDPDGYTLDFESPTDAPKSPSSPSKQAKSPTHNCDPEIHRPIHLG
jgi:lactoylglutathione lyase